MQSQQFKELANSRYGKVLYEYVDEIIKGLVDVRTIEEVTEVEILGRKRAAELLEINLLDRLKVNKD